MTPTAVPNGENSAPSPRLRIARFLVWVTVGIVAGWLIMTAGGHIAAGPTLDHSRFDAESYPAIDVSHVPADIARADEMLSLEFRFACGFVPEGNRPCAPEATLFATWGEAGTVVPISLTEEDRDTARVLVASLPATDKKGAPLRYYLEVREKQADVFVRYPTEGFIEPMVLSRFVPVQLGSPQAAQAKRVLFLPWGGEEASVGLDARPEQGAIGPDAFDIARDGTIALLDQANGRVILAQKGTVVHSFLAPIKGVGDVAFDPSGDILVLDMVGTPSAASPVPLRHLYRFSSDGVLQATVPLFARYASAITDDLTILDMAAEQAIPLFDSAGNPLSREQQSQRATPSLKVRFLDGTHARLADSQTGVAFDIRSDEPMGAIPLFARTAQGYVVVFEDSQFRAVWFDDQGKPLQDVYLRNEAYTVVNPVARVASDEVGSVYVMNTTERGIEIVRIDPP